MVTTNKEYKIGQHVAKNIIKGYICIQVVVRDKESNTEQSVTTLKSNIILCSQ